MLKNLGFDMTSSAKKENGGGSSTNDQDEIGERTSQGDDDGCFSVCEEGPGICSLLLTQTIVTGMILNGNRSHIWSITPIYNIPTVR